MYNSMSIPHTIYTMMLYCYFTCIGFMTFVLLIRKGYPEVVQILVNGKDTDPNLVNNNGDTALHIAVW